MEAKFNMTIEQNIFVAKRNIIDYMWKSARLEGIGVTYPDTEAIFNGLTVQGVSVKDTVAINNLKHSWGFVLENVDYPMDYPFICKINQIVGGDSLISNAGFVRKVPVSIGGTTWKPDIPIESIIKEELVDILKIESPTERAIILMLYCMLGQMFLDGNKRTGMLAGNHCMITNGAGIISIPIEHQREFTALLIEFYETKKINRITNFVYDKCIDGIAFDNSPTQI